MKEPGNAALAEVETGKRGVDEFERREEPIDVRDKGESS